LNAGRRGGAVGRRNNKKNHFNGSRMLRAICSERKKAFSGGAKKVLQ